MLFDLCHPVKRRKLIGFLLQLVLVPIEECWFPHILRCWYAPQTLATPFSSHQRKLPVKGQVMNHLKNALNDIQHTWRLFRLCYWIVNVGIFDCFTSGMFHNWKARSHDQLLLSTRKKVLSINNRLPKNDVVIIKLTGTFSSMTPLLRHSRILDVTSEIAFPLFEPASSNPFPGQIEQALAHW